jgi:hypothetical protein
MVRRLPDRREGWRPWGGCRSVNVWGVSRAVGVRGVGWVMVLVEKAVRGCAVCLTEGKDGGLVERASRRVSGERAVRRCAVCLTAGRDGGLGRVQAGECLGSV